MVCKNAGNGRKIWKSKSARVAGNGNCTAGLRVPERVRGRGDEFNDAGEQFRGRKPDANSNADDTGATYGESDECELSQRAGRIDELADGHGAEQRERERDDYKYHSGGDGIRHVRIEPAAGDCGGAERRLQYNVHGELERECKRFDFAGQQCGEFSADDFARRNGDRG